METCNTLCFILGMVLASKAEGLGWCMPSILESLDARSPHH